MAQIKLGLVQYFNSISYDSLEHVEGVNFPVVHHLILSRFSVELSKGVVEAVMSMYNERLFSDLELDSNLSNTLLNAMFRATSQVCHRL